MKEQRKQEKKEIAQMREEAEQLITYFRGETDFDFGYNEETLEYLDDLCDRLLKSDDFKEIRSKFEFTLASFLGQCIIENYGGNWIKRSSGWWVIEMNDASLANPFWKVHKKLDGIWGEEMAGFFRYLAVSPEMLRKFEG